MLGQGEPRSRRRQPPAPESPGEESADAPLRYSAALSNAPTAIAACAPTIARSEATRRSACRDALAQSHRGSANSPWSG
jgi:hypothetical protein